MKRFIFIIMMLIPAFLFAQEPAGVIKKMTGKAQIISSNQTIQAKVGSNIYPNDTIITEADSSIGIIFQDDTLLSLGPNSKIIVDRFVFDPNNKNYSFVTKMSKGTAVFVNGNIGRLSPKSVKFETPLATLGLRGTKFAIKVDE
ncbi:MAG: FecR domain-containing protein [Nitrospirae bacterium]|nr:FecR domain-containing protein [Nitrospirota bacterium]MBF0540309.1 FecR domain-containing protein [Nitrospirota bacterium]